MLRAYLAISQGGVVKTIPLGDDPITIGRHPDNVVAIGDSLSSRFHCVVTRSGEGVSVRDLTSRNGTRLNGETIGTAALAVGDVITIGAVEIRLLMVSGPPKPVTPVPVVKRKPSAQPAAQKPAKPAPPPVEADDEVIDLMPEHEAVDDGAYEKLLQPPAPGDSPVDFTAASGVQDDEKFLPVLAESLPDCGFPGEEIALIDARGHVVHPAASSAEPKRKQAVAGSGDAVAILRYILLICIRGRATDIHLEPKNEDFALRLRIDGNMVDIVRVTKAMGIRLASLVKVVSHIDVQYKNTIQEGHFSTLIPGRRIDYRVSFAPAMFGQKLVVRVLDTANAPLHLPDLHMPPWMMEEIKAVASGDSGLILVCGPTGSGKTTTLYATLRDMGVDRRNVVTIEDPVEIEIPGVTQVPVDEDHGNSFPALLRSMLRQDPDVIMVGEVRDPETARIAMQAAMTGHLVLSTVHARDTIGALLRLIDLGTEPYLVSASLAVVISQRLARQLCPFCKRPVAPTAEQLRKMGSMAEHVKEIYVPNGCLKCLKTGFAGRRGFFETLVANDALRETIMKKPTPRDLEAALAGTKFLRLVDTGYQLVVRGITAFDEIERAVGR